MQYTARKEVRKKEKRLSAALTLLIWGSIMLFFFLYRISMPKEEDKTEVVTTMLINFGDNRNGKGVEEPMEQEGSKVKADAIEAPTPSVTPEPMVKKTEKSPKEDKIISGKSEKSTIKKNESKENTQKNTDKTTTKQKNNKKNTGAPITTGVKKIFGKRWRWSGKCCCGESYPRERYEAWFSRDGRRSRQCRRPTGRRWIWR